MQQLKLQYLNLGEFLLGRVSTYAVLGPWTRELTLESPEKSLILMFKKVLGLLYYSNTASKKKYDNRTAVRMCICVTSQNW